MTTNSHMFTVQGTTFGAFCAASFFSPSLLFSTSPGIMEVFMFKARTPPSILQLLPHPHPPLPHLSFLLASIIAVCFWESAWSVHIPACVCVCVQYEGCSCCRSTKPGPCVEMQPPGWTVLSLPTSPAGSRGSSWLVVLCLQTDGNGQRRGEVENRRGGGGKE